MSQKNSKPKMTTVSFKIDVGLLAEIKAVAKSRVIFIVL